MSISQPSEQLLLLQLFHQHLRGTLVKQAIDAIRPDIEAQVEQVLRELKPKIQARLDPLQNELVMMLSIDGAKGRTIE